MDKSKRSFTLIELLIVVAIIAILASMLMPSLRSARYEAEKAVCISNLKSTHTSSVFYTMDNRRHYPFGGLFRNEGWFLNEFGHSGEEIRDIITPYFGGKLEGGSLRCPGTKAITKSKDLDNAGGQDTITMDYMLWFNQIGVGTNGWGVIGTMHDGVDPGLHKVANPKLQMMRLGQTWTHMAIDGAGLNQAKFNIVASDLSITYKVSAANHIPPGNQREEYSSRGASCWNSSDMLTDTQAIFADGSVDQLRTQWGPYPYHPAEMFKPHTSLGMWYALAKDWEVTE